jgi:hypothetical protein
MNKKIFRYLTDKEARFLFFHQLYDSPINSYLLLYFSFKYNSIYEAILSINSIQLITALEVILTNNSAVCFYFCLLIIFNYLSFIQMFSMINLLIQRTLIFNFNK